MPSGGFGFGPFRLDLRARRLLRDETPVPLQPLQFDVLHVFVSRPGELLTKDQLIKEVWRDVIVSDNSLVQVVSRLRTILDADNPERYIETVPRRGYRFVAAVTLCDAAQGYQLVVSDASVKVGQQVGQSDVDILAMLAPYRAWLEGRAGLETVTTRQVREACQSFTHLVRHQPHEAALHAGLATACGMLFESTRTDQTPDTESLQLATTHAHEACRLDPELAEAWAALGFVLEATGDHLQARSALQRAITLEPDNHLHHFRLGTASWGEDRIRSVRRVLVLYRRFPMAYWLIASVFVARGELDRAEREIDIAVRMLTDEGSGSSRFSPVAVFMLKGLLCLARGADDEAMAALQQELALEERDQIYARECCANTWYIIGALLLLRGDRQAARAAFGEAIARVPLHPRAHAGLAIVAGLREVAALAAAPMSVEVAIARATVLVAADDSAGAAQLVASALASAPPGNAGWLVLIEPLLFVQRDLAVWAGVLAMLGRRAE